MIQQRELNVKQVAEALNLPYQQVYQTLRFFSDNRIPTRKYKGRLLIPADALSLLQEIHLRRRNRKIPNGWIRLSDFCRKHGLNPSKAAHFARKLQIAQKFFPNFLCIHESNDETVRILIALSRTGRPPEEWVRLTEAIKSHKRRQRLHKYLYLVQPIRVGNSVYLRREELEYLLAEVRQNGRNYKIPVK